MANFIVLRLKPASPVDANTFFNYLKGLTISVYDVSFATPRAGVLGDATPSIGTATYNDPVFVGLPAPPPPPPLANYPAGTTIAQHFTTTLVLSQVVSIDLQSVATAVIPYVPPAAEYPSGAPRPDLRIHLQRGGSKTIVDPDVYYDVPLYSAGAAPSPADYQGIPSSSISAYVTLPAALDPALAGVEIPADGSLPNYDDLLAAINTVLAADPGGGATLATLVATAPLTADRCKNIAHEIIWGAEPPLPQPPEAIENMYTKPPNDGGLTNGNEQSRQQFEGQLNSYYATREAQVERLTKYVYAVAAAIWCGQQTAAATEAMITFPVNPTVTTLTTIKTVQVALTGALGVEIPAEYFYVLGAMLPVQIAPEQRLRMATGGDQQQNLTQLMSAYDTGALAVPPSAPQPPVNPAQAVRLLSALSIPLGSVAPTCRVASAATVWGDFKAYPVTSPPPDNWLSYKPGDDAEDFWPTEQAKVAPAVQTGLLNLDLCALSQGYVIANSAPPVSLADFIAQQLVVHSPAGAVLFSPVTTIAELAQALASDWENLFKNAPLPPGANRNDLLPPFTAPGTPDAQIAAFVRYIRKFFDLPTSLTPAASGPSGAPPTLPTPIVDPIQSFVVAYQALIGGVFTFGTPLVAATVDQAVANVFPSDPQAQQWLKDTIETLNDLCALASVPGGVNPLKPDLQFSVAEALYARGITSVADVLALSQSDFQDALRGTIAYDQAAAIYAKALTLGPPMPAPTGPGGPFNPVNPGTLTNCIPPCHLSPLGAVEYLHELLQLSENSTCKDPYSAPTAGHLTLGDALAARRGPLGNLRATRANEGVSLPLIDIVNESLEAMCATTPPTAHGVVYDTAEDTLAGLKLCVDEGCCGEREHEGQVVKCHDPTVLFAALPEHSTPAGPTAASASVEPAAFNVLKSDFSSCCLPYSQPLDVDRTYLRHFCTSRFETMRTFRRCITEFVLAPEQEPSGFQDHLWRYPVRIDIAIEYLCITPEEYVQVFGGHWPANCGEARQEEPPVVGNEGRDAVLQSHGFSPVGLREDAASRMGIRLPQFLELTCLTYCEFLELWKSKFVLFTNGADRRTGAFPECEPCCLDDLQILFPEEANVQQALYELIVFIRLWRKLKGSCGKGYSFEELGAICSVLELFSGGTVNPDFIRQLAAFQMLRDVFALRLVDRDDPPAPGATGANRLHILALWAAPGAAKWEWAVRQLLHGVQHRAQHRYRCALLPEVIKLLHDNLDPLSRLAGFDLTSATETWHALSTHTLRFAEILAKIAASNFGVGEILFLFTADPHVDGDDPFALQGLNEGLDAPLGLPDGEHEFSLWRLRHKLLETNVADEDLSEWTWQRIVHALQQFGFAHSDVTSFGEHFFPDLMAKSGYTVPPANRGYTTALAAADTAPRMWNTPPEGPFNYDLATETLWTELPLLDHEVIKQFGHLRPLTPNEQQAVQDLYFSPRRTLAAFAMIFADFAEAERRLIEEREHERWSWFQRQFAQFHRRCHVIAEHLSEHVRTATGQKHPVGVHTAFLLLQSLSADENFATSSWEDDGGHAPATTWTAPRGGAFAALLGLTGTGLLAEYARLGGPLVWRDLSGPTTAFSPERNAHNCPVPTIVPSLHATVPVDQQQFVTILNGMVMRNGDDAWLGGAEAFTVKWTGALAVEDPGTYEFCAGGPTPEGEPPNIDDCEHQRWRVILKRGQQTWLLLKHGWGAEGGEAVPAVPLKRGVYEVRIEFTQNRPPILRDEDARRLRTGFQLKYTGPDTDGRLMALPHHRLFRLSKDATLSHGLGDLTGVPASYLQERYTSSLRDIRRTYQRGFKALLFAHRFRLSTDHWTDRRSELGYMLAQKSLFAGRAFYRSGAAFSPHAADFDFNLLPLLDDYYAPAAATDARVQPSLQRRQALFDWWERIFDYTKVREEVERDCDRRLWRLFDEAEEKRPAHPGYLLRHMGADARHWSTDLHYFQSQAASVYALTADELQDDRWVVRAWHADEWIKRLLRAFCAKDIRTARPDLWAADDPSAVVPGLGPDNQPNPAGLANLSQFLIAGCLENDTPKRYEDLKRLNDCLRERGRDALLAYLCAMNRTPLPWGGFAKSPKDLSSLLLIDVEAGIPECASRIEEAVTAAQSFVRRARLGLEPGWTVNYAFAELWDRHFTNFKVWEACKCRELYKENWIDWNAQAAAQKVESFQFLQSELRRSTLTAALPGGLEYWPDQRPPGHPSLLLLQDRDPSTLTQLNPPREGLGLLGAPERDARPSWLAPLSPPLPSGGGDGGGVIERARDVRAAPAPVPVAVSGTLPLWIEAAIRLGVRFYRVAAGGVPPASAHFEAREYHVKPGCCTDCGKVHPEQVDEYYFWLLDSRFFKAVDETDSASFFNFEQDDLYDATTQDSTRWHDQAQLPPLLDWRASSAVRLAWCRVHNGEFKQPRRSYEGVAVTPGVAADLTYVGRVADSLVFSVTGGLFPTGYLGTDAPGFRYDLAIDSAIPLPLVVDPPVGASPYAGGLPAYPYFIYVAPGAPLFPGPLYSPALAIACALRTRCRFEAALKWYALVFDPLKSDDAWMDCEPEEPPPNQIPGVPAAEIAVPPPRSEQSACCDTTDVTEAVARDRSVLLHYLETLLEWGDALMRRHSPEAFQQARLIFDTAAMILGPTPVSVNAQPPTTVQAISAFTPLYPPLNPRLLGIYGRVEDRLCMIRNSVNERRLRDSRPRSLPYWGQEACCGCRSLPGFCANECNCSCHDDDCQLQSPYQFLFLLQKAQELAALVKEFGGALQGACEKGDAEFLGSLRATHELEVLNLARAIRQNQWREADWQRQALQTSKAVAQTNRRYYATLIQNGLNSGELQFQDLTEVSLDSHIAANVIEGVAEAMDIIPDLFVGFPCEETWLPLGTKLAGMFKTIARITNSVGDMASQTAGLDLTQAGWARRLEEWVHQVEVLDLDIQQIERQILAAERRQDGALRELNNHQRQIENSKEVQDFLRDRFTNHELYLYLQKETAALHAKAWELALHAAEQAERAFNFERGDTGRRFLPSNAWDTLHEGLMAGERLQLALRTMEQAYLDLNVREYELAKHFSLRLHFPIQFLQLKTTGVCEIELPEWIFDLDHPGQYMRRIRNVTLTIPCVTGPYTGVHARVTLLSSKVRVDPSPSRPPAACCGQCDCENDYEACRCDPRFAKYFGAREAIATSSGQNDSGLFELNFRDERYLPFEFFGAVSRWRIELPPENNFFDMETLSDVVMNLNYTAREGGNLLRRAANEVAQCNVRHGWALFDVRHEFPDAWQLFRSSRSEGKRRLTVRLTRRMFPYLPCDRSLLITRFALLFETPEAREQTCCKGEYTCCNGPGHDAKPCRCGERHQRHCEAYACGNCEATCCCECIQASHVVNFTAHEDHDEDRDDDCECGEVDVRCVASADWPALYHGVVSARLGPLDERHRCRATFEFPQRIRDVPRVFLLCHYEVAQSRCEEPDGLRSPRLDDRGSHRHHARANGHLDDDR